MKRYLVLAVVLTISSTHLVQADEIDDELALRLGKTVRNPQLTVRERVEAAQMLGKLGSRSTVAVPYLTGVIDRLRGPELEPLQEAVIDALGQIGSASRTALPSMAKAAGRSLDITQAVKRSTDQILASSDAQNIDILIRQLRSRDSSVRLRAVKALGNLGPAARFAVPNVLDALNDADGDVRRAAIAAIRQIIPDAKPTEAIVRALAADLADPDPNIRLIAVRALGRTGQAAAGASAAIETLRTDPDPDVRRAAVEALSRILGP